MGSIKDVRDQNSKLQIEVNKSSVEAVDKAQKKQKEAEKKMEQPTYDNGFNQKIADIGVEAWGIRILAIVAVLFIVGILMVIIMKTIKQYKKMWNEISQMNPCYFIQRFHKLRH